MIGEILTDLAGVGALALLCGAWVAVQRWIASRDPGQPGVEDRCGSCRPRALSAPKGGGAPPPSTTKVVRDIGGRRVH